MWPTNWVEPRPSTKQGVANRFGLSHAHEKNQNKNTSQKSHYKIKTNDGNFFDIDLYGLKKGVWPANWVEPRPSTKQGVANHFELSHTHEKIKTKTLPRKVITKSKQMMVIFWTLICVKPDRWVWQPFMG